MINMIAVLVPTNSIELKTPLWHKKYTSQVCFCLGGKSGLGELFSSRTHPNGDHLCPLVIIQAEP